jgi:acyl-coenzyme A synthetase/AMP-(fatty) acid ligase
VPNFVRDVLGALPRERRALVALAADATRQEWNFGQLLDASGRFAGLLTERGARRGTVVLTLLGNRIEYPLTMLACLRIGAAMLPCSEQLRPKDISLRMDRARPAVIVCDERNRDVLDQAAPDCAVLSVPTEFDSADVPDYAELDETDPAFVLFTSGTSGAPKLVSHGQRYLAGQQLQAREWMAATPGELVWSTASPGWSKSARNAFLAPWLCGAAALLQDRRFDPAERLETIRREQVNVLCMAPTEYRLIAGHGPIADVASLRRLITAGEALGVPALTSWQQQTGLVIADGYGQTETGQVTGVRPGEAAPPGSMGRALPGIRVEIVDGQLCVDPTSVPTFFLGYDFEPAPDGWWHTGDRVRQDEAGWLFFESRADDIILSAGYRIGPVEVEATLLGHPAVRECGVVGLPDDERGELVTAFVVLRDGFTGDDELVRELQDHVKAETAPYKYPRRVVFLDELPKTTSGKIHRAALKQSPSP